MKIHKDQDNSYVQNNRRLFFDKVEAPQDNLVSAYQDHTANVYIAGKKDAGKIIDQVDAFLTDEKNLFLTVTSADCLPIYFYNPKVKVVGLAHAGWLGLNKGIIQAVVNKMEDNYSAKPEDCFVFIGPHIKACHFEVKDDVLDLFKEYKDAIILRGKKYYLDLGMAAKIQLARLGVRLENIEISPDCTYCEKDKYFSYRRDGGVKVKAQIAFIAKG